MFHNILNKVKSWVGRGPWKIFLATVVILITLSPLLLLLTLLIRFIWPLLVTGAAIGVFIAAINLENIVAYFDKVMLDRAKPVYDDQQIINSTNFFLEHALRGLEKEFNIPSISGKGYAQHRMGLYNGMRTITVLLYQLPNAPPCPPSMCEQLRKLLDSQMALVQQNEIYPMGDLISLYPESLKISNGLVEITLIAMLDNNAFNFIQDHRTRSLYTQDLHITSSDPPINPEVLEDDVL